ncbi:MAG: glycosyltransferase family 9 protein [Planctomycetes bacterium]|nr:glycosyltransferase family 9 protein [Planctomycetota bacterium]
MELFFHRDCVHYRSDRPCAPHKREGVVCDGCKYYVPSRTRVLIVKLAAAGDVLRTTAILPALRKKYENASVHWVTAAGSAPLLDKNPTIDRIIPFHGNFPVELLVEEFDVIMNFDASVDSAAIATAARGRERYGYGLDPAGFSFAYRPSGEAWLAMGLRDDYKKSNRETYQNHILRIAELEGPAESPQLILTDAEREFGAAKAKEYGIREEQRVVGLNTGAGGRWPLKRWTEEGFCEIARRFANAGAAVLLLGGPEEVERNKRLVAATRTIKNGRVVDAGCNNTMRQFAAIVDRCDAVVTGDTLAMHVATALGKQVVALFGPTSSAEIDLFGRGEKITSTEMPCLVCYLNQCDLDPNCMNTISPDRVEQAVLRCLASSIAG